MAKHIVTLEVELVMDDMEGTPERSAEIARGIIEDMIFEHFDKNVSVEVTGWQTAPVIVKEN